MAILYFWTGENYRKDTALNFGWHLNQNSEKLHKIEAGENLWAFTRRDGKGQDNAYVLVAKFVITRKTRNPANQEKYGRYRVWADPVASRLFSYSEQDDISKIIKSLSIRPSSAVLGNSFTGRNAVKIISDKDDRVLKKYSENLVIEFPKKTVSDEQLEQALMLGDDALEAALSGVEPARQQELRARVKRNRELVMSLRNLYNGCCQICEWSPRDEFEQDLCEGHHINWLGHGGIDDLSNMVLLCPNHHRAVHRLNAPFDWESRKFFLGDKESPLKLSVHDLEV
jgi:hypothetical protein